MVLSKVAVTGATGMLGRHLVAAMASAGLGVIAPARAPEQGGGGWNISRWMADEELDAFFPGAQAIVHAAAMVQTAEPVDRARMFDVNVRACLNLGEWALRRGLPIVHISSATVYANPRQKGLREEAPLGWSGMGGFYALTKLLAEDVYPRLAHRGLKYAIVRPSSLYGYGLPPGGLLMRFLATAKAGHDIAVAEPAEDSIDFIHASDLAKAVVAILRGESWGIYNVASDRPVSLLELAQACQRAARSPGAVLRKGEAAARAPFAQFCLDTSRARSCLDWHSECDIPTGIQMILEERLLPAR